MNETLNRLNKLQNELNKERFHLHIKTDLETELEWNLYQKFANYDKYMSSDNRAILNSRVDSIDDLEKYLRTHNGLK